jgi:hypothetical protein
MGFGSLHQRLILATCAMAVAVLPALAQNRTPPQRQGGGAAGQELLPVSRDRPHRREPAS